ncbi:uncharacterized protein L203_105433 [Cryptococcus depauperatus CBS 7841]|uniref:Uncharacterized protein n=1 Tax=Cryptococcus depauperatus CBS 7841 TaxID=1295531 RepID=A0AAJ8M3Y5_9TREE
MNYALLCSVLGYKLAAMATPVYHLQDPTILNEYAPIFKLSKGEQYFPSGVEYMLPHYSYMENFAGEVYPVTSVSSQAI